MPIRSNKQPGLFRLPVGWNNAEWQSLYLRQKRDVLFVGLDAVVQLYHVAPDKPDQVGEVGDGCFVSDVV